MQIFIGLRKRFKEQKDWASADLIRDGLKAIGIVLEDGKDGTGWRRI
jgi:cysteinyl-tRNA synthetase